VRPVVERFEALLGVRLDSIGLVPCLRAELATSGIGLSTICPGIVHTNIIANTQFSDVSAASEADKQQKFDRLYEKRHYTPDKVAERIVAAGAKKKSIVPVTPEAHVAYHARRFVPALGRWLAKGRLRRHYVMVSPRLAHPIVSAGSPGRRKRWECRCFAP
jgi:short-subunit dehydrogenase